MGKKLDAAQPQAELFGSVWGVLGVCLECVWGVFGKWSGNVREVFGKCLGMFRSVWKCLGALHINRAAMVRSAEKLKGVGSA